MDFTRRAFLELAWATVVSLGITEMHFQPERKHTHMAIRLMIAGDRHTLGHNPVFTKTFYSFTAELYNQPPPPPIDDSGLKFCNYMTDTYGVGLPPGQWTSIFMYQIFDNGIIP